jgi:glycerol-3-phosphate acyltransferase PlsY
MGVVVAVLSVVVLAYLLGTFPSADLVARHYGVDVTKSGSGNPGASNVMRLIGWKAGVVVLVADAAKGAIAAAAGLALDGHRGAYIRGVATGAGVLLVVYPLITAGLAIVWVAIARGLHKASVASIVCAVAAPVLVVLVGGSALDIAVVCGVAVMIIMRHGSNLRRLVRGEEHGLGETPGDRR